jgi:hypothetical protein
LKEQGIEAPATFKVDADDKLSLHPNTEVVFKLLRLIWPHVSEEGFRKRWFYKDDIVE